MANDYRILDERDIKNFQAGNKLSVTEIDNKVTYEHIGEPPNKLPLQEQALEYGGSFDITVPSVYDSTGHVKSETTYSFKMPDKVDTSNGLTKDIFGDMDNNPVSKKEENNKIIYYHDDKTITNSTPASVTELTYGGEFSVTALSAADGYGHVTEQKTYKFKMPAAPSGPTADTSGFLKKENFKNTEPILVSTTDGNVTYSHKTISQGSDNPNTVSLNYGENFSFSALSAADSYGHANQETTYTFKMPNKPTIPTLKDEVTNTYYYSANPLQALAKEFDTPKDLAKTSVCFITFYGGAGYKSESDNSTKMIFPGIFTLPFATYGHTMSEMEYPISVLKFEKTNSTISEVQKAWHSNITIQLNTRTNEKGEQEVYLHITFPINMFERIDIMGF